MNSVDKPNFHSFFKADIRFIEDQHFFFKFNIRFIVVQVEHSFYSSVTIT